ncbi:hypothetical protein FVR03_14290 [Pontibacter qinzhouensis]|uniref:DUF378 domain-containing protein n=1 Tax=Pontibacter qinzhouensis TaxID=2603253 RepID=A0A5C8JLJ6_9BACT|nr:hypothetical protein [Pontibacter qinzhouensis]TXK38151.1 hypothetical protein FVR03_14290 [Pontibacter qinzhouensis]
MKFFGILLFMAGLLSLLLELMGANLLILNWLNQWGPAASWGIRISAIVLGAILYYVYRNDD